MENLKSLMICLFICTVLYGQQSDLMNEITNYNTGKSILISKARQLLIDNIIEGNTDKVNQLTFFLEDSLGDENYTAFYPIEYWLLLYNCHEWDKIPESVLELDSLYWNEYKNKIKPSDDNLGSIIKTKSKENLNNILAELYESNTVQIDEAFLKLLLYYLVAEKNDSVYSQDFLNDESDNFLETYGETKYNKFIKEYIRHKLVPSKSAFGYDLFLGYGSFNSEMAQQFTDHVAFGVALDFHYKQLAIYNRYYLGVCKTKQNINFYDGIWYKGDQGNISSFELSVGYDFILNQKMAVTPFGGITATGIYPPTEGDYDDENYKNIGLNYHAAPVVGINLDFMLVPSRSSVVYGYNYFPNQAFWFLRLRYTYTNTSFEQFTPGFPGDMHSFILSIGVLSRKLKLDR